MDVFIFNTQDGGDINPSAGSPEMRDTLESFAFLSLFGGNIEDDGRKDNPLTWWGNIGETVKYVSETQHLLATVEPTPRNLRRIEDAVKRDLGGFGYDIAARATMPGRNMVDLGVDINGVPVFEQVAEWGAPTGGPPVPVVTLNNGVVLRGSSIVSDSITLVRADGSRISTMVGPRGEWVFSPYPLGYQEAAEIFAVGVGGAVSAKVPVVGVAVLRYDGSVLYDGSRTFNGIKL